MFSAGDIKKIGYPCSCSFKLKQTIQMFDNLQNANYSAKCRCKLLQNTIFNKFNYFTESGVLFRGRFGRKGPRPGSNYGCRTAQVSFTPISPAWKFRFYGSLDISTEIIIYPSFKYVVLISCCV